MSASSTQGLDKSSALIGTLAGDPSLRGLTRTLSLVFVGVQNKMTTLDALARPFDAGRGDHRRRARRSSGGFFLARNARAASAAEPSDLRRFIEVHPVLDYSALEPGTALERRDPQGRADLDLAGKYQARVRLTGSVPMADEEFATVQQGALVNGIGTVVVVLVILWLALNSARHHRRRVHQSVRRARASPRRSA